MSMRLETRPKYFQSSPHFPTDFRTFEGTTELAIYAQLEASPQRWTQM